MSIIYSIPILEELVLVLVEVVDDVVFVVVVVDIVDVVLVNDMEPIRYLSITSSVYFQLKITLLVEIILVCCRSTCC